MKKILIPSEEDHILGRLLNDRPVTFVEAEPFLSSLSHKGFTVRQKGSDAELSAVRDCAFPYRIRFFPADDILSDILSFQKIDSTNMYLRNRASEKKSGTIAFTEEQEKGKGKWDRTWFMKKGKSLLFSVLLKVRLQETEHAGFLTQAAAIAVADAARKIGGIDCGLKWPNDVLAGGRKLCGVLTENLCGQGDWNYIVVGIGVNVNYHKEDFPLSLCEKATSLSMGSGREICRYDFFQAFWESFADLFRAFIAGNFSIIMGQWQNYSIQELV